MKEETKKPNGYWDYEHCYEAAQQCKTRNEFQNRFSQAYHKSLENGWIEDYTWFVDGRKLYFERRTYWTKEACYEAALQCTTRTEFARRFSQAYHKSLENGWLKDYTWFVDGTKLYAERRTKWNEETCREAALQCKTRKEFKRRFDAAYHKSLENGWIEDYTWFEQQYNGFKDFIYIYEFPNNVIYVGRSVKPKERDYQHIFKNKKDSVNEYAVTYNCGVFPKMQIIEECENATIGSKREIYWMDYYKNNGYTLLNKAKGGSVGSLEKGKWNEQTCYEAALQCTTRTEFARRFSQAYHKSLENGWLKDYTWFVDGTKLYAERRTYWTKEACYEAALQCTTRTEFQNRFSQAYHKSLENGWLKDYTWFVDGNKLAQEKRTKWNEETCREAALQCTTRTEFARRFDAAYHKSLENGWLDEFFPKTKQAA